MTPEDFKFVSAMLKQRSGLILGQDKLYLLESRLTPLARRRGMASVDELIAALKKGGAEQLKRDVTEAMTTNETSFFRDIKPFEQFRDFILPELLERRAAKRSLRIWSAAASTGQEAYTLAMILREQEARLRGWRVDILATDLAGEVLEKAKAGIYSQFEVQRGMPIQLLVKYFEQHGEMWHIDSSLKAMVKFRQHNLLESPASLGTFDVVFCRNVLIYFDQETKRQVFEHLYKAMAEDGYLCLGGAETVLGVTDRFKPVPQRRGLYAPATG